MAKPKVVYDPTQKEIVVDKSGRATVLKNKVDEPKPEEAPIVTEKAAKPKRERKAKAKEPKPAEFPLKGFVNPQGFIYLSKEILEAFGAPKGKKTAVIVDFNNGALIIAKDENSG